MPGPPGARSALDGQVVAHPPLVPGTVVVGEVSVTEAMENEERHRRRDPAVAVGDYRLVPVLGHARLPQPIRQLCVRAKRPALGVEEALRVQVCGPGDPPGAPPAPRYGSRVLPLIAGVEDEGAGFDRCEHVLRLFTPTLSGPRSEGGGFGTGGFRTRPYARPFGRRDRKSVV